MSVKVSILMSLYWKESSANLDLSLQSVVEQIYKDWELVLVVDGEIGKELENVIGKWKLFLGERMKVVRLEINQGLATALNRGMESCSAPLVARMDTDDFALPHRLVNQVEFLELNPDVSLVGCYYDVYDENLTNKISTRSLPVKHEQIEKFGRQRTPINHPTIVFRLKDALEVGGYPENMGRFEDWGFALRLIKAGKSLHNMPIVLLKFRGSVEAISRRGGLAYFLEEISALRQMRAQRLLGLADVGRALVVRAPLRLIPVSVRSLVYRHLIWQ